MKEYIEREVVDKVIETARKMYLNDFGAVEVVHQIKSKLCNMPNADVQPIIHAKWILFDRDSVGRAFYCSNCRKVTTTDDFEDTPLDRDEYFCMRCGADMREV